MAKAKKSKARKTKAKKSRTEKSKAKKAKKIVRRAAAASRGKAKKSKARTPKKAARKAAKPKAKAVALRKRKQIIGEGDYEASRSFLKDEADFVKRHSREIPAMAKEAEAALEGPEGGALRAAEEQARSHNKTGEE